jgi:hypothetical protein
VKIRQTTFFWALSVATKNIGQKYFPKPELRLAGLGERRYFEKELGAKWEFKF